MTETAPICRRTASGSVSDTRCGVSFVQSEGADCKVVEKPLAATTMQCKLKTKEMVVCDAGLAENGHGKKILPRDVMCKESNTDMNYRKENFSDASTRRCERLWSPLSAADQIRCNRCGATIPASRTTAVCRFFQVSAVDSNRTTHQRAFTKFKRRSREFSDPVLGISVRSKWDHQNYVAGHRNSPHDNNLSSGHQCSAQNVNSSHQTDSAYGRGENVPRCICISDSTCRRSPSRTKGHGSELDLESVSGRQHSGKCEQFSKRVSSSTKSSKSRSREYLQRKSGNLLNKPLSKSDLSKAKVANSRTVRSKEESSLRFILSWIITLIGFFVNCSRTFGNAATYKRSNGFTRNCITFALWTLVILPGDSKRVLGNSLLISPGQFCTRSRNLNAKQQEICHNYSAILRYVEDGVLLGSHRCQKEFQYNRWNCSSAPKSFYSRLLNQDVRETAYVTAVTSAAVTYAVTYACSRGELADCGCAEKSVNSYDLLKAEARKRNIQVNESQLRRAAATFDWGGCSDLVEYGEHVSEIFTKNFGRRYQSKDLRGKIEEHNLQAGRLAITNHMRRECRCHGLTGSCTLKTCWEKMPKIEEVATRIRDNFDKAVRVQLANDGSGLLPTRKQRLAVKEYPYPRKPYPDLSLNRMKRVAPGVYPPGNSRRSGGSAVETERRRRRRKRFKNMRKKRGGDRRTMVVEEEDLVYSQESPNFCRRVRKHGTLGTIGRRCIPNSTGAGSCEYLCCGRTYSQSQLTVTTRCNCRLESCCELICDECTTQETIYTCD